MSWFNPKAFAAGALSELEGIIDKNVTESTAYEANQREIYKTNKQTIAKRRQLVTAYQSVANQLKGFGVTDAQIRAAHSSGLGNLGKLRDQVVSAVDARGGRGKVTEDEVTAMITSGGILPEQDDQFASMDLSEFLERSMNLPNSSTLEAEPELNLFQRAFGASGKDSVRAKLDREIGPGGMSIYDINQAASLSSYESLMPGAYATFSAGVVYDPEKAYTAFDRSRRNKLAALRETREYKDLAAGDLKSEMLQMEKDIMIPFAIQQWTTYGKKAADDRVMDYENMLGTESYNELYLDIFGESKVLDEPPESLTTKLELTNGAKIFYNQNGDVTKIILPPTGGVSGGTVTDPDQLKAALEKLQQLNLLTAEGEIPEPLPLANTSIFDKLSDARNAIDTLEIGDEVTIGGVVATVDATSGNTGSKKFFVNKETGEALGAQPETRQPVPAGSHRMPDGSVMKDSDMQSEGPEEKEFLDTKVFNFLKDYFGSEGNSEEKFIIKLPELRDGSTHLRVSPETLAMIRELAPELLDSDGAVVEKSGTAAYDAINPYDIQRGGGDAEVKELLKRLGLLEGEE